MCRWPWGLACDPRYTREPEYSLKPAAWVSEHVGRAIYPQVKQRRRGSERFTGGDSELTFRCLGTLMRTLTVPEQNRSICHRTFSIHPLLSDFLIEIIKHICLCISALHKFTTPVPQTQTPEMVLGGGTFERELFHVNEGLWYKIHASSKDKHKLIPLHAVPLEFPLSWGWSTYGWNWSPYKKLPRNFSPLPPSSSHIVLLPLSSDMGEDRTH